ncbi:P-loop containing nucleoside triphosphate hydrolase protein [Basidiobolus meristosporus CBS 931.73]|uniref:Adenylate kinase isoenzyme 6 homolog n=1 Tax=Basidiobolus meristosporus CBS 931.73 TaxID=1314790 RepID=A0A1Y1YAJ5_9FUNG|nr:P-loop containing nucleoside triphosphate hydrolase protein [Basidiobolus meristosporus CBS 931.73]|eukprot:ORX95019.1 P-loop containing nucleoside triphosphate hydrolase protein [Basidiobolus meristosporus CBS 931.73]
MSSDDEQIPQHPPRTRPNILITGTPGTGKTTTSELAALATGLEHICVGQLVKEKNLHDGRDETYDSYILNDDKLCDELEDRMGQGGCIIDFHSCDVFPERWFDLVVVLRTDNSVLYDRLVKRGYNETKITENIECEIMQVVLDEAREGYRQEIVVELNSNTIDEMEDNVERVRQWTEEFIRTH